MNGKLPSGFVRAAAPAAVTAVLCLGVAVAVGAIPASDGQIHGCYTKVGGILRVIDTEREPAQQCTRFEESISWSQQGPPGPQGEPGPPGPSGSAPDFWAIVRGADGSLFRGSHVAATVRNFAGSYSIIFDEPIPGQSGERPGCAMNVTPTNLQGDLVTHTLASPITYTGSSTTVHVEMRDPPLGDEPVKQVDQSFALALAC